MPILVVCECGKSVRAKDELRGKKVRCPGCSEPLLVVDSADADEAPDETPDEAPRAAKRKGPPPLARKTVRREEPREEEPRDEDEPRDDDEDTGAKVWTRKEGGVVFVVAVGVAEVCAGSFPKKAWQNQRDDVEEGRNLEEVFAGQTCIPFEAITQVRMDLKRTGILVDRPGEEDKVETATIPVTDDSEREEIFAALRRGLGKGWRRTEKVYGPLRAALYPGAIALCVIAGTIIFYLAAKQAREEEVTVSGRNAGLKRLAAWLLETLGPTGVLLIGLAALAGCIAWAVVFILKPPHWVMLEPRAGKGKAEE